MKHILITLGTVMCAACFFPGCGSPSETVHVTEEATDFEALFKANCSGCHGLDGRNGPAPLLKQRCLSGCDPPGVVAVRGREWPAGSAYAFVRQERRRHPDRSANSSVDVWNAGALEVFFVSAGVAVHRHRHYVGETSGDPATKSPAPRRRSPASLTTSRVRSCEPNPMPMLLRKSFGATPPAKIHTKLFGIYCTVPPTSRSTLRSVNSTGIELKTTRSFPARRKS